ncbi:hypothetical protein DICVIV_13190 [Dictyocaulus viviparus]|uniref:Uncharacterized protein n=1 Tax=Dictyocaulus viviparus TaxID=29172 RepID=A0A0D8X8H9_DICVI|nr:hypothetical protein DICVIV_13190 [Dictyocaulus viviparus]
MQQDHTSSDAGSVTLGLHAVVPLPSCPHLNQTNDVPESGIDANSVCDMCSIPTEPWICLTCYKKNQDQQDIKTFDRNNYASKQGVKKDSIQCTIYT